MISVKEAKELVGAHVKVLNWECVNLYDATGQVLAELIYSPIDMPSFHQSAMDGYGIRFEDLANNVPLKIIGEVPAGMTASFELQTNTAVRIYTGAQIPMGCDTVIVQEKVLVRAEYLIVNDVLASIGLNIRLQGSQTKKGIIAMSAGTIITAGAAGFLASLGFHEIKVIRKPKICIINTGRELINPGSKLVDGKVFESNSFSLNGALVDMHLKPNEILRIDDDEQLIREAIASKLKDSDVIILSGGVSVGDYDFVAKAIANCSVKEVFHKVKQRPGKPLFFGVQQDKMVFGLPGNPGAALTCFYEYIAPCLRAMMGIEKPIVTVKLPLTSAFQKKAGLTFLMKGIGSFNEVRLLPAQESYLMSSFSVANCIVELAEERTDYEAGEEVDVRFFNAGI